MKGYNCRRMISTLFNNSDTSFMKILVFLWLCENFKTHLIFISIMVYKSLNEWTFEMGFQLYFSSLISLVTISLEYNLLFHLISIKLFQYISSFTHFQFNPLNLYSFHYNPLSHTLSIYIPLIFLCSSIKHTLSNSLC